MAENIIADNYYTTMDQEYHMQESPEIGVTVFEGAEGRFPQSVAAKIKMGADAMELQLSQEDFSKGLGAESYGKEARQDIKDLAEFNRVKLNSVHISHLPNMSGLGKEGFDERVRDQIINEIRKEIEFAGDVTNGASVVVHTGEFPRPMAGKFRGFEAYPGEEREAVVSLANKETGDLALQIRSDQEVHIAREVPGKLDEFGRPVMEFVPVTVNQYVDEIKGMGKKDFIKQHNLHEVMPAEKLKQFDERELAGMAIYNDFLRSKLSEAIASKNRWEAQYKEYSEMTRDTDNDLQKARQEEGETVTVQGRAVPKEEAIDMLERRKNRLEQERNAFAEYVRSYGPQIEKYNRDKKNTIPIRDVALTRTTDTLAQAGIMAFDKTKQKRLKNPLFMTPENISPYEYGSHPDEMIEMVEKSRKRMVQLLTNPQMKDMKGRLIDNPNFHKGISEKEAKKLAEDHIKATLDTQHLGMWKKNFERKPGETEEQRDKRFNKWYLKEVEKLAEKGVLGNVHLVDGMGLGHSHLPAQQGIYPVAEAVEKLRAKGFVGPISSEGHGEGPERQLTAAWQLSGKPTGLYHAATQKAMSWTDVESSYFGSQKFPVGYIVGDFAKRISPDFTLWSGVPLE